MTAQSVKFDGCLVKIGTKQYVMAPLTLKMVRRFKKELSEMTATVTIGDAESKFDSLVNVIHASLTRNYPDIKREDLEDDLDMGNIPKVIAAVMGVSGMEEVAAPPGGESDSSFLIGTASTATSSPASPDGPGNT